MKEDLQVDAFKKFWRFYTKEKFDSCGLVSFDEYKIDSSFTMGRWYDGMELGFTQELINSINKFSHEIDVITIWSKHVIPNYPKDEQLELTFHFLELPFYYCLNQPQSIRDRIIFSSTHLCHQANLFINTPKYKDDLPEDWKIGKNTLKSCISQWKVEHTLLPSLEAIASNEYVENTYNYRNMAHHRVPPSLQYGHTNYIRRFWCKKSEDASYNIGYEPPLTTEEITPHFIEQHKLIKHAFSCYWKMVQEHLNSIT